MTVIIVSDQIGSLVLLAGTQILRFNTPSELALETQPPLQWVHTGLSPKVKLTGARTWRLTSNSEVLSVKPLVMQWTSK
jgi:hypothetical protein